MFRFLILFGLAAIVLMLIIAKVRGRRAGVPPDSGSRGMPPDVGAGGAAAPAGF